ncbi:uncharacterized protein LOC102801139 [Saccoglossus kowalevskii]|uniref:Uncharacterized protein LOC102801139 n=1 Tax=Saccoglossus kowalevskii TaxID=10224 RepID=A0ABM0MSB1_SACKO|nr:PREDICTED: uncharacterized protein LOC102801139 [Saccoglossus kowalevskii]
MIENSQRECEAEMDQFVCGFSYITYENLAEPVKIVGREGQEYTCEKRLVNRQLQDCDQIAGIILDPQTCVLTSDAKVERLLLCYPSSKSCYVWQIVRNYKPVCNEITAQSLEDPETRISEYEFLMIYPPLRLKDTDVLTPCLTLNQDGLLVPYTATCKAAGPTQVIIYNPIEKKEEKCYPDHVLFDISGSMSSTCWNRQMSKLDAIKNLFHAFADRSMAYNFRHVIGLTTFNCTPHVEDKCTEAFESVKAKVQRLYSDGGTAMYDAKFNALSQLREIGVKYLACKKRILCLTDGDDGSRHHNILDTTIALQASDICLDSVLVGSNNRRLQCLSSITGGCCFFPESEKEGLQLFEMETVLSLGARKDVKKTYSVRTQYDIDNFVKYAHPPYDKQPAYCVPDGISKPVSTPHMILNKVGGDLQQGGLSTDKTVRRKKSILREISAYQKQPHPLVYIFPCDNNIALWRILLVGPLDTPYEGGVFSLYAEFPENYPLAAPKVRFVTPIYHCNINAAGRICHSIFDRDYTSRTPFSKIMLCVFGLLITPEPDDPLDSIMAEEYITNHDVYKRKARDHTHRHASKSLQEHKQELLGNAPADSEPPPPELICPLTGELFVDPVGTPSGKVYERHALESRLSRKKEDPLTGEHLQRGQLKEKNDIKKLVTEFRNSRITAAAWWQP